ncbi:MAG: FAD:protein FMN transferase [Oscillibacter sp.]|jgi:thiamine biosynthesis lipoprotein|nr:FAD:protein FMN transferase [uncultured Oscillibacter sp.]MCI8812111.1 FAD:protein FMN transferase [Oscillibacter sp.]
MRRFISIILAPLLLLSLTGCFGPPVDPDTVQESIQVIAMDTPMLISTYGRRSTAAAYASEDLIRDLESRLSRTEADSAVSRLNRGETVEPDEDLTTLLRLASCFRDRTGGAFNIGVAPLVSAWGFTTDHNQVPAPSEISRLLKVVEETALQESPEGLTLGPDQAIDLGGIAKGYAADKLADLFREYEIPRAMAQLGGNVLAWGDRPDGTAWRVGVQDPARPGEQNAFAGILNLKNAFAVTSGGYQRYFEESGKRYHHIIDPATGYPADSDLTSVTVVADCTYDDCVGTLCDAFSTAFFIMGEEEALDGWREWQEESPSFFDLVLITEDGRVVVTQGLAESFTLDEGSGYTLEIVS